MDAKTEVKDLAAEIGDCRNVLNALADETRLQLIAMMLHDHSSQGLRTADIADKTDLSRPAVSHHLQILKAADIVKVRREGTKTFYYFDGTDSIEELIALFTHLRDIVEALTSEAGSELADKLAGSVDVPEETVA